MSGESITLNIVVDEKALTTKVNGRTLGSIVAEHALMLHHLRRLAQGDPMETRVSEARRLLTELGYNWDLR